MDVADEDDPTWLRLIGPYRARWLVAAVGIQPWSLRGVRGQGRVRVLRPRGVPPQPAPPGDLRPDLATLGRPPGQAAGGPSWRSAKGPALNALGLAEDPSSALARYTRTLDAAWRHVAGGLIAHPDTVLGADGRLHAAKVTAVPDPPSLTDLRTQCQAMLPRVDPPELILEVMSWCPGSVDAFTAASGGQPRMADHT